MNNTKAKCRPLNIAIVNNGLDFNVKVALYLPVLATTRIANPLFMQMLAI